MRSAATWLVLAAIWSAVAALPASAVHGMQGAVLVTPLEYAKRLLDAGERLIFVDLRPPEEFKKGRLPGAHSLPLSELRR